MKLVLHTVIEWKGRGDALLGAPRDVLQVRDRVAKLLHDTMYCYETNKFMPSGEIELGGEQNRTNDY